jgi:hypothetical protein
MLVIFAMQMTNKQNTIQLRMISLPAKKSAWVYAVSCILLFCFVALGFSTFNQVKTTEAQISLSLEVSTLDFSSHCKLSALQFPNSIPSLPYVFEAIAEDEKTEDNNEDNQEEEAFSTLGLLFHSQHNICKLQVGHQHSIDALELSNTLPLFILYHSWKSFIV